MFGTFLLIVLCFFLIAAAASSANKAKNGVRKPTVSSDGHKVPKRNDVTCAGEYGHVHDNSALENEFGKRYIVHDEPETGYVVLNGVKRRLKDCGKY